MGQLVAASLWLEKYTPSGIGTSVTEWIAALGQGVVCPDKGGTSG